MAEGVPLSGQAIELVVDIRPGVALASLVFFRFDTGNLHAQFGSSPAIPIDPSKLVGVQWKTSTPVVSDGGATGCTWNISVSNVRFY